MLQIGNRAVDITSSQLLQHPFNSILESRNEHYWMLEFIKAICSYEVEILDTLCQIYLDDERSTTTPYALTTLLFLAAHINSGPRHCTCDGKPLEEIQIRITRGKFPLTSSTFKWVVKSLKRDVNRFLRRDLCNCGLSRLHLQVFRIHYLHSFTKAIYKHWMNDEALQDMSSHLGQYIDHLQIKVRRELPPYLQSWNFEYSVRLSLWIGQLEYEPRQFVGKAVTKSLTR